MKKSVNIHHICRLAGIKEVFLGIISKVPWVRQPQKARGNNTVFLRRKNKTAPKKRRIIIVKIRIIKKLVRKKE